MRFVCDSCRAQYNISDEKVGAKGVKVRCKKCGYVILVRRDTSGETAAPPPEPEQQQQQEVAAPPPPDDDDIPDPDVTAPDDPTIAGKPLSEMEAVTDRHHAGPKDETPPPAPAPTSNGSSSGPTSFGNSNGAHSVLGGIEDDEMGAIFDQVLSGGSKSSDGEDSDDGSSALGGFGQDESTRVISQDALRELAQKGERMAKKGGASAQEPEEKKEDVPETDWYVAVDEEQRGPLTLEKLKDMWERGEVGPDSLCWRAGYSDWIALSEVAALKQVLAPKPAKPQIMSPGVVTVPVETSFNSGGMAQSVRTEMPMMASGAAPAETGGWKPSAASALASLVSEEMSALAKPSASRSLLGDSGPNDRVQGRGGGLFDAPGGQESPNNGRPGGGGGLLDVPMPSSPGIPVRPEGGQGGYSQPAQHNAPSPYPTYQSPAPSGMSKGVMMALGGVGLLLLVIVGLGVALVMKPNAQQGQPSAPTVVAEAPKPEPAAPKRAAAPAPAPVAAAPTPAASDSPPMPPPPPGVAPTPVAAAPKAIPSGEPVHRRIPRAAAAPKSDEDGDVITPTAKSGGGGGGGPAKSHDDEFEDLFGGGGKSAGGGDTAAPPPGEKKKKTVYVPDAPGAGNSGGEVKDSLATSDVMQVVLANKAKIQECTKSKPPGGGGKLLMKWSILTSGKTTSVQVQTEELKGSPMANCVTTMIKGMTFPKHRTQGEPIVFPFTY